MNIIPLKTNKEQTQPKPHISKQPTATTTNLQIKIQIDGPPKCKFSPVRGALVWFCRTLSINIMLLRVIILVILAAAGRDQLLPHPLSGHSESKNQKLVASCGIFPSTVYDLGDRGIAMESNVLREHWTTLSSGSSFFLMKCPHVIHKSLVTKVRVLQTVLSCSIVHLVGISLDKLREIQMCTCTRGGELSME